MKAILAIIAAFIAADIFTTDRLHAAAMGLCVAGMVWALRREFVV